MNQMTTLILAIVITGIAWVLVMASVKPSAFSIKRSATIKAPPDRIAAFIADFRRWGVWSPWENIDADLKRTFSGAESGVGAVYAWEGKKAGSGRMEITGQTPREIDIKLDFTKPMQANNITIFSFEPAGDATTVVWEMKGKNAFMGKLMSVFMNMDKMVGKSFEEGLAKLKAAAEA